VFYGLNALRMAEDPIEWKGKDKKQLLHMIELLLSYCYTKESKYWLSKNKIDHISISWIGGG
jgi:hypothetical protein